MKTLPFTCILALTFLLSPASSTARAAEGDDNIYNYLQLFRSDLNSAKVEVVNQVMKLSAADAQRFWPIYRQYELELGKLAISRTELIAEFVEAHKNGTFDNAHAKEIARRWFQTQRARLKLLEKYHGKIQKALSPIKAGQFLQIENQIAIFMDMAIASEMPMVGQAPR